MDDTRLDRLLEYTKFHIGIYLSAGGGILLLLGSGDNNDFIRGLIGKPLALGIGLIFMAIAGFSGGVIASATTQHSGFGEVWDKPQGPFKVISGLTWARVEHTSFWISVALVAFSVLASPGVWSWLTS